MSDFYDCSRKKLQDLSIMEIEWLRLVLESLPEDVNVTWGVNDLRETYDTISGQLTERQVDVNSTHISELYGKCFINPSRYKIIHIIGPNKDNNDLSEWEYEMYIQDKDYKAIGNLLMIMRKMDMLQTMQMKNVSLMIRREIYIGQMQVRQNNGKNIL